MTITAYPFDAGAGSSITEAQWRRMMRRIGVIDSVINEPSGSLNKLAVSQRAAGANLSVDVASGEAFLNGHFMSSDAVENLAVGSNSSGNPRIDRVVVRLDATFNTIVLAVLAGTPGASPVPPTLTQAIDGVWEISLAQIAVANGAASIVTANITDERRFSNELRTFSLSADRRSVTGATTADMALYSSFFWTMTGNVTVTVSNWPVSGKEGRANFYLKQDGTGSRTVTWPAGVLWPGGVTPTLTTTANKTDVFVLITFDGGTTIYGFIAGQNA